MCVYTPGLQQAPHENAIATALDWNLATGARRMPAKHRFEPIDHALELKESLRLHAAERIAQRVAGLLILAAVIAALLGLFGDGRFAKVTLGDGAASLRYERVLRASKETVLRFDVPGTARITIPLDYFGDLRIARVTPQPARTHIEDGAAVYVFESASAATLRFYLAPGHAGVTQATILVDRAAFPVRHLVLP